jgi:hypothetical protein
VLLMMLPLLVMREWSRRHTIERVERMIRIGRRNRCSLLVNHRDLVGCDLHRLLMVLLMVLLRKKVSLAAAGVHCHRRRRRRRRRRRAGEITHPAAASHCGGIVIRLWNGRGGRRGRRGDRAAAAHAAGWERIQRKLTEWIEVHGYLCL